MRTRPRLQLRTSNVSCTVETRCVDTDGEIPLDEQFTTVHKYSKAGRSTKRTLSTAYNCMQIFYS